MKKLISVLLATAMLGSIGVQSAFAEEINEEMVTEVTTEAVSTEYKFGDVNEDGEVDEYDFRELLNACCVTMLLSESDEVFAYSEYAEVLNWTEEKCKSCDIDGNGIVNVHDCTILAEIIYIYNADLGYEFNEAVDEFEIVEIIHENNIETTDLSLPEEELEAIETKYHGYIIDYVGYEDGGTTWEIKAYKYGDVNGDGNVDSGDATEVLKYYSSNLAGIEYVPEVISNEDTYIKVADFNSDGSADAKDATAILQSYAESLVK